MYSNRLDVEQLDWLHKFAEADAVDRRYWRHSEHLYSDSLDLRFETVVESFAASLDSVAAAVAVLAAVAFAVAAADEPVVAVAAETLAVEIEYSFALSRSGHSKRPAAVGNCAEMPPWR